MFSELNAKRCSGLLSHTIGQVVKLPQWWWESAQFTSMLKWVAVPAELQHWEVEQEGAVSTAVSTCKSVLALCSADHLLANCHSRGPATVWPRGGSKY